MCNECGRSLDAPRATVVGARQRRLAPLLAGVFAGVIVLAYATSLGPKAIRWSRDADCSSIKPDAWLVDDVWSRDGDTSGRVKDELFKPAADGTLGRPALDRLVTRLLARPMPMPRMPGVDFESTFAAYVAEEAWRRGIADERVVRRAMRASLACRLVVAPTASAGRTLRYWIACGDFRIARADADEPAAARVTIADRADALDGRPVSAPTWSTLVAGSEWPGLETFGNAFDLAGHAQLGPATLTTRFTATLTLAAPGRPTLVETRDVTLSGTTTLVEPSAMACPPVVAAPPNAVVVAAAATTQPALLTPRPELRIFESYRTRRPVLNLRAPADGAMLVDVILRSAAGTRPLGTVFLEPGSDAELPFDPRTLGPFEIELRPVPARGADLLRPVPVFVVPVTVPSSAIEGIDDR